MLLLESVLKLVLGLVFFLYGMTVMSSNLEKLAGGKLENALKKATSNPFVSLLLGAGITIAIQSSSATTVMLVGLVNSGIMKFSQTLFVIFGANIGTTLTAWILALAGVESGGNILISMMKPENFSPVLALIGILMLMGSKIDKRKSIGTILIGFAVLMYGMEFMKIAVEPLTELEGFGELLIKFQNPIVGVVVGSLFTALIQSSAASVGILQALAMSGGITYSMAIPIIMGQNIGTCITSIISCIGTNANAKRVAAIHLSVNMIGTVILLSVYTAANSVFGFAFSNINIDGWGISLVHTIFNVAITILLAPFGKLILRMAEKVIKDDKKSASTIDKYEFTLDERLLRSPSVAIGECSNFTVTMSEISHKTLNSAMSLLGVNYNEETVEEILRNEERLDKLEDSLGSYLVKLSGQALSTPDSRKISKMLHTIGDFERLGDHAVNLMKNAKEMHTKGVAFSEEATKELNILRGAVFEIVEITMQAFSENDLNLAAKVEPLEQVIDGLAAKIKNNHIKRLQVGECTIELGFILSDLLNNYERISDHCSNIAVAVIELIRGSFDTHKYLTEVKYGNVEFGEEYKEYKIKYSLD